MDDDNGNGNGNVFQFGAVKGGKSDQDGVPINDYVVTDIDGNEFFAKGFLIFTPHHLAIMLDMGKGPIPVLCLPIGRVMSAELDEEDHEDGTLI